MSDAQLAMLLYHLMRQINQASCRAEESLRARGASVQQALDDPAVVELRALAGVLERQAMDLTKVVA